MESKVSFKNRNGEVLIARLVMPARQPIAFALFAHCFTCTKNFNAERNICAQLSAGGIAVLLFDFTGLGESGGSFGDTNFSSNLEDLYAAAEFLAINYQAPKILVGHSLGGTAVICAAAQIPSVKAVATIGSPAMAGHVTGLLKDSVEQIKTAGSTDVLLGGRSLTIKRQFLEDIALYNVKDYLINYHHAVLVLHSPLDSTVSIDNAAQIYALARHPKSFVSLDSADHLLSKKEDAEYAGKVIAAWAGRFV